VAAQASNGGGTGLFARLSRSFSSQQRSSSTGTGSHNSDVVAAGASAPAELIQRGGASEGAMLA
jgi:hypothetical protein